MAFKSERQRRAVMARLKDPQDWSAADRRRQAKLALDAARKRGVLDAVADRTFFQARVGEPGAQVFLKQPDCVDSGAAQAYRVLRTEAERARPEDLEAEIDTGHFLGRREPDGSWSVWGKGRDTEYAYLAGAIMAEGVATNDFRRRAERATVAAWMKETLR